MTTQRNLFRGGELSIAEIRTPDVQAVVRCEAEVNWLEVRFFLAEELVTATDTVRWRFDRGPLRSATWGRSPNGKSVIVTREDQAGFIRQLQRSGNLTLLMTGADGTDHEIRVPLGGSGVAIAEVLRHCR